MHHKIWFQGKRGEADSGVGRLFDPKLPVVTTSSA